MLIDGSLQLNLLSAWSALVNSTEIHPHYHCRLIGFHYGQDKKERPVCAHLWTMIHLIPSCLSYWNICCGWCPCVLNNILNNNNDNNNNNNDDDDDNNNDN